MVIFEEVVFEGEKVHPSIKDYMGLLLYMFFSHFMVVQPSWIKVWLLERYSWEDHSLYYAT